MDQGSLFPTPVLAQAGMGTLSSGGPKLYPWSRCFHSQGDVTDLCCLGDTRGTQTMPPAVVETTEPPDLPLWECSCTCVGAVWGWFLCKPAVQRMVLLVRGVGGNNVKLNSP